MVSCIFVPANVRLGLHWCLRARLKRRRFLTLRKFSGYTLGPFLLAMVKTNTWLMSMRYGDRNVAARALQVLLSAAASLAASLA